jgi:hypothetical protein
VDRTDDDYIPETQEETDIGISPRRSSRQVEKPSLELHGH